MPPSKQIDAIQPTRDCRLGQQSRPGAVFFAGRRSSSFARLSPDDTNRALARAAGVRDGRDRFPGLTPRRRARRRGARRSRSCGERERPPTAWARHGSTGFEWSTAAVEDAGRARALRCSESRPCSTSRRSRWSRRRSAHPAETLRVNLEGTWNLLEAARVTGTVEQFFFASSDKAYGLQATLPYTEDLLLLPRHPYDVSKACGEALVKTYAPHLRPQRCDHPLREPVRARGSELRAVGAGRAAQRPGRRAARAALRRFLHPRLPLRQGRGARLPVPGRGARRGPLAVGRGVQLLGRDAAQRPRDARAAAAARRHRLRAAR